MSETPPGVALRGVHADESWLVINHYALKGRTPGLTVTSPWFEDHKTIPLAACGPGVGDNVSPPLAWSAAPEGTQGWLIVLQDPDAPVDKPWVHFMAGSVDPGLTGVAEGALAAPAWVFGKSTGGEAGYHGPRALPGHGPHRYFFQILALSKPPGLTPDEKLPDLLDRIAESILAHGVLVGIFER